MSLTITVLSQKGGTGKTTLVRNVSDILTRIGLSTLAIDLDPQANLSDYFDVNPDAHPTLGEVLAGQARAVDAVVDGVLPANLGLAEAELILSGKIGREMTLKRALREVQRKHDVLLIDCPPTLGLLTVNSLVAADYALLSTEAQYFSLQGVEQALEVLELAKENLNPDLEWLGIVLNICDMRTIHSREALKSLQESFGDRVFEAHIKQSIRYAEASERGLPMLDYKPELGRDYVRLTDEILERLDMQEERAHLRHLQAEVVAV